MPNSCPTPVAFLIFNRPQHTLRVFEEIRAARPKQLLVVADGPRAERAGEEERCAQTRAIIEEVDWPCDVLKDFAPRNMGCAKRVSSGLDWVFAQVDRAIVLEDDCIPDASFFPFATELLDRYCDDQRIFHICGHNFQLGRKRTEYSYYFSRYSQAWGWASWRRAWAQYDFEMKVWPSMRDGGCLEDIFENPVEAQYWKTILQATFEGQYNTWDYQWFLTIWRNHGLTIVPERNMITNVGFDSDATHTGAVTEVSFLQREATEFPLRHPDWMVRNRRADEFSRRMLYSFPTFFQRVRRKLMGLGLWNARQRPN